MQQLTLNKLSRYNLFNKNSQLISCALFISINEIKVSLKINVLHSVIIELYNHNNIKINYQVFFIKEENSIILKGNFDINVNYYLKFKDERVDVIFNPKPKGIIDSAFFVDDDFGIKIFENNTVSFKLWSPPAVKVELLLFSKNQIQLKIPHVLQFNKLQYGVWELVLNPKDIEISTLDNFYYQYKITAYGKERVALDPYAKSMAVFDENSEDNIGRGAIISINSEKAYPKIFNKQYVNSKFIEDETDIIAYEVNIRDFSIQPSFVDYKIAGTFKGLTKQIDYLKKLGITHVQLMPVNKAYTQNEIDKLYTSKFAEKSNYNWGYDPMNYFTLEGRYSTNPDNPYSRIVEFREMVQLLHDAGIGVILDVVFNHTYIADTFENIAPGCYYRHTDDYKISGHTGAGASLESRRKQVRKFIIDVLKFYVVEYHIDGFRFDLMSFHDKETMKQIRKDVGYVYNPKNEDDLILQGEAWYFTDLRKGGVVKTDFDSNNIAVFNDTFRDAIAGDGHKHGFIHGNTSRTSELASAIIAGINSYDSDILPFNKDAFFNSYNLFANEPSDCLNFMSVHDGLTLWDKINLTVNDESKKERLRLMKFAYSILLTSQGKIILHGGDEILRTKPLADFDKEKHRAFTSDNIDTELDTRYFHENSYCSNDYTNMFRWDRLTNEYSEFAQELLEYVKGLINMRRSISAFRFNSKDEINQNITFLDNEYFEENVIHSFKSNKLEKLIMKFKNGKPNSRCYLTGEVHKTNANPIDNYYLLRFDKNGNAEIIFNKKEIAKFDLQKWDLSQNLNFKLVKTFGKWDFNRDFYSDFGYNSISPESVDEKFEVEIDLNIKDNKNLRVNNFVDRNYIAYLIDNKSTVNKNLYKKMLVIHNAGNTNLYFKYKELDPNRSYIILDNINAGIFKLNNSESIIKNGIAIVSRKSSTVIVL